MENHFSAKVREYCDRYQLIEEEDGIVIGVSGGADSMALMMVLNGWRQEKKLRLAVVHVHHGIRGAEADADEAYVRKAAENLNLPFFVFHLDIPAIAKKHHLTEEETGRMARYRCFQKVLQEQNLNKIAVAHHEEDQAETVLFQMIRGSMISGLAGMRPVRGNVIRPMLSVSRKEIETYLQDQGIRWRTDSTNQSARYARNRIRHEILPVMEEIHPGAVRHLAMMAADMRDLETEIQRKASDVLLECRIRRGRTFEVRIEVPDLKKQSEPVRGEVILRAVEDLTGKRKDLTRQHIRSVLRLMDQNNGSRVDLPYGILARKNYSCLVLEKKEEKEKTQVSPPGRLEIQIQPWNSGREIRKPASADSEYERQEFEQQEFVKQIDCDRIRNTLQLRFPEPGDVIQINREGGHKKLRPLFTDLKIDQEKRDRIPVVADGHEIVWVVGYRLSEGYKITRHTRKVAEIHYISEREDEF